MELIFLLIFLQVYLETTSRYQQRMLQESFCEVVNCFLATPDAGEMIDINDSNGRLVRSYASEIPIRLAKEYLELKIGAMKTHKNKKKRSREEKMEQQQGDEFDVEYAGSTSTKSKRLQSGPKVAWNAPVHATQITLQQYAEAIEAVLGKASMEKEMTGKKGVAKLWRRSKSGKLIQVAVLRWLKLTIQQGLPQNIQTDATAASALVPMDSADIELYQGNNIELPQEGTHPVTLSRFVGLKIRKSKAWEVLKYVAENRQKLVGMC
jgi:hypothetical protein